MKRLLVVVLLASLPLQAYAQMGGGGGRHRGGGGNASAGDAATRDRRAKEEAAAKAAMEKIPDSKEKYDPWKIAK